MLTKRNDDAPTLDPSFDWFTALAERTGPEGRPHFTVQELEDFFAAILLTIGFDLTRLPEPLVALLNAFATRADVSPEMPRNESIRRVERYFRRAPLNRELLYEFKHNMRAMALAGNIADPADAAQTFARFCGMAVDASLLGFSKPPPAGSVRGGPLGFHAAQKKLSG
jgi:hypothetical protein